MNSPLGEPDPQPAMLEAPRPADRVPAAVGHLGLLALPGIGFVVPLLLRSGGREDAAWLDFQLLQAVGWNVLQPVYLLLVILVEGLGLAVALALLAAQPAGLTPDRLAWALIAAVAVFSIFGLAFSLAELWGAFACLLGRDFRYPWLGSKLVRYLADAGTRLDRSDRFLAAMAHAAILMPVTGMLLPLWNLLAPAGRTAWKRFHALQTLVYQGAGALLALFLTLLGWLTLLPVVRSFERIISDFGQGVFTFQDFLVLVPVILVLTLAAIALLLAPLYQTLGLVAAARVLKGRDFVYSLVSRFISNV